MITYGFPGWSHSNLRTWNSKWYYVSKFYQLKPHKKLDMLTECKSIPAVSNRGIGQYNFLRCKRISRKNPFQRQVQLPILDVRDSDSEVRVVLGNSKFLKEHHWPRPVGKSRFSFLAKMFLFCPPLHKNKLETRFISTTFKIRA